jgi:hypothetical protein
MLGPVRSVRGRAGLKSASRSAILGSACGRREIRASGSGPWTRPATPGAGRPARPTTCRAPTSRTPSRLVDRRGQGDVQSHRAAGRLRVASRPDQGHGHDLRRWHQGRLDRPVAGTQSSSPALPLGQAGDRRRSDRRHHSTGGHLPGRDHYQLSRHRSSWPWQLDREATRRR